jgi:hypothetical protein
MTAEERARADARVRAWVVANPDRRKTIARAWARAWRDDNAELAREQAQRYRNPARDRIRYHTDPQYRAVNQLRCKLHDAVKRLPTKTRLLARWGARSTIGPLIGCSPSDLKSHLEALFRPGMSWANYGRGGWEIDHIKPCASFDLTDPDQCRACFHYSNLRPLWFKDNQAARRIPG